MGKRWIWALPAVAVLAGTAASYLPFVSDDALISLRYARRLLDGHGLTWTAGAPVEGYSNLLWVLLCAALGKLGLDLIVAARTLGLACTAAALLAVQHAFGAAGARAALPGAIAALALALTGPLAVWAVGGLEQPLLAALLAWALATALPLVNPDPPRGAWVAPGVFLALACLTRPDGALFTAAACLGLLVARGFDARTLRLALRLAALPSLFYLAQLGFRLAYYGAWVPNSARAKVALSATRVLEGLAYVGEGLLWLSPLVVPALWLAATGTAASADRSRVRFLAAPLVIWTAYVAVVGGDSFPARRHLVPTVVILGFLLAEGLRRRLNDGNGHRRITAASMSLVTLGLVALGLTQHFDPENRRARVERWEWDGKIAGEALRRGFPAETLLATDAAGTLPYFSGLPSVDMLGLNDRYLATHPPADFGKGPLGHELGDGEYVLSREPDLILFCGPAGGARPCFRSGREMVRSPVFQERYRLATLSGDGPPPFTFQPWVRAEGGRTGIRRERDTVQIPAYLLMATGKTVARPADGEGWVIEISPLEPAGIGQLRLGAGSWKLTAAPPGAVRLTVGLSGSRQTVARGDGSVRFALEPGRETVDVLVEPSRADGPGTIVRTLIAERVPG